MKTNMLKNCYKKFVTSETKELVRLNVQVANRIFDILEERGLSQRDFAKLMGKTEPEVCRWLSGTHNFTMATIASINVVLGEDILEVPQRSKYMVFLTVPREATINKSITNTPYMYNPQLSYYEC